MDRERAAGAERLGICWYVCVLVVRFVGLHRIDFFKFLVGLGCLGICWYVCVCVCVLAARFADLHRIDYQVLGVCVESFCTKLCC